MNGTELVSVLEDAGLSPYQADAYVTLLELGSASARDIANASSVPDPRIYDVLRDLETKGFIEIYDEGSLHARAHSPNRVIADLKARADRFEEAASEINDRWTKPPVTQSHVSVVADLEMVIDDAIVAIRGANNQVQLCVSPAQLPRLEGALRDAIDSDVHVKLSIASPDRAEVDGLALEGICTEARYRELPAPFLAVVDRRHVCFAPHRDSINEYGVLVEDRSHAYVFHWFFITTLWDIWDTVYTEQTEAFPRVYVDVRYCIRDIATPIEEGATVTVRIVGAETATGTRRTIEGVVTTVATSSELTSIDTDDEETLSVARFAGIASMTVDTGEEQVRIGGTGATVEEFEAERIIVLSIEDT